MVVNGGGKKMGNIPEAEGDRRRKEGYVIWEVDLIREGYFNGIDFPSTAGGEAPGFMVTGEGGGGAVRQKVGGME